MNKEVINRKVNQNGIAVNLYATVGRLFKLENVI
jgi:hypothetical protein